MAFFYLSAPVLFLVGSVCAQSPATVPVPPLQWIRLNPAGSSPPALAYAAAGFDTTNNQLVLFGGETSGGLLNSNTYLLDMSSMTWTTPSPSINTNVKPPARSRALYGQDMIASYRNGVVVYGGIGQGGALSDVWEYVFTGQFWYNISVSGEIPSARFSAVGGGDPPSVANASPDLLTTFWLSGGLTGSTSSPSPASYDDIYRLQLQGTIAQNFQNATGTWTKISSTSSGDSIGTRMGQAGMSMRTNEGQANLGLFGGCENTNAQVSCAQQDAYVIVTSDGSSMSWNNIAKCPSARLGAVLTPNYNPLFSDMAFLLLGLSPNDNSTDTNGLDNRGEVDVLSISQGVWTRVLPSCDPSSTPPCPVPREGAAVVSSANTMAGTAYASASDIIIFGGKDKDGNVLGDAWLLRAMTAQVTYSNQTNWGSEYGSGTLGSGVNTHGQGVTDEFLTECAQPPPTNTSSSSSPSHTSGSNSNLVTPLYTAGVAHKSLAAVSVLVILVAVLFERYTAELGSNSAIRRITLVIAGVAWALGVGAFATSFTTTRRTSSGGQTLAKRDSATPGFASTGHAIAGCVLFVLAYVITPIVSLIMSKSGRHQRYENRHGDQISEMHSLDRTSPPADEQHTPGEKSYLTHRHNISISGPLTPDGLAHAEGHDEEDDDGEPIGAGKRVRLRVSPTAFRFWSNGWKRSRRQRLPSPPTEDIAPEAEAEAEPAAPSETGFVVLNRGRNALDRKTPTPGERHGPLGLPLRLSDVSWLERRRNVGAVGDLDYAMSQMRSQPSELAQSSYFNAGHSPTQNAVIPATIRVTHHHAAKFPTRRTMLLRITFQGLLFALCIFVAVSIFTKGVGGFGVPLGAAFVVIVALFYASMLGLAIGGKPEGSTLVVIVSRLQGTNSTSTTHATAGSSAAGEAAAESRPLADQTPMVESATLMSSTRASKGFGHPSHYSVDGSVRDDDEEVEGIEREMGRRDVSIVTVPKRRLFIANSDTP